MIPVDLELTVRELDRHVSSMGWDQPTRLFALADTEELLAREPSLASQLLDADRNRRWTTVEQDGLPQHDELDELLRGIAWPDAVAGAAIVTERVMIPPGNPASGSRHDVRITMGVLRDGARCTALRLRAYDSDDSVIVGEELVSGLGELLLFTLSDATS
ncbi:MAG TPA: PPA1309 family protein [Actinomycetes bacterium]|nr:PPA1309 family protein [Actinomycetes bacterium]